MTREFLRKSVEMGKVRSGGEKMRAKTVKKTPGHSLDVDKRGTAMKSGSQRSAATVKRLKMCGARSV